MKCNQSRPGCELESPCSFPTTITITPLGKLCIPQFYLLLLLLNSLHLMQVKLTEDMYSHVEPLGVKCSNVLPQPHSCLHFEFSFSKLRLQRSFFPTIYLELEGVNGFMPFSLSSMKAKHKQSCPGYDLTSLCLFPTTINIRPND